MGFWDGFNGATNNNDNENKIKNNGVESLFNFKIPLTPQQTVTQNSDFMNKVNAQVPLAEPLPTIAAKQVPIASNNFVNGLGSGAASFDKSVVDIVRTPLNLINNGLGKILPTSIYDPSQSTPINYLNNLSNQYGNLINQVDSQRRDTLGNVVYNAGKFIPQGLGLAMELATPLGAGRTVGNVLENSVGQVGKLAPKLMGENVASRIVGGGLKSGAEFGTLNALQTGLSGGNLQDIGNSALQGAGAGLLFGAGGKAIGEIAKGLKPNVSSINPSNDTLKATDINTPTNNLNPLKAPLAKSYTVQNTNLDKAQTDYNNAIDQIHNYFQTNKLTPQEVTRIQPELGINLNKLVNNIETAKTSASQIGNDVNLANVAGVTDLKHPSLVKTNVLPNNNLNLLGETAATKTANVKIAQPYTTANLKVPEKVIKAQQADEIVQSNFDPTKPTPTKLSMNIVSSDKGNKLNPKDALNNAWNSFYTHAVDKNKPISDFSKAANDETYIKATNAANVSTTVNHILDTALVDRQGKPIDTSYKDLVKSLPTDKADFSNYLLQLHNIDRAREGVPVDPNYTTSQSSRAVQEILKQHPEYKAQGEKVTQWINKFMGEWGNKSGLISDDLWNSLNDTYKNYISTNRNFTDIEGLSPATNSKGFTGQSIPLKKATGSTRDITDPFESTMNVINRTVRSAKYNEVAQSMLDSIKKNPEAMQKYGEIIPEGTDINANVKNVVTVLDHGNKVNVQINDIGLLKALEGFQKGQETPIQDTLRKITSPYKAVITTKNPLFTVRNMARDIPTAYVNGSEHNPLTFGKNYLSAMKDLTTNSPIAQQYNALGGGGSNFDFNSNNTTNSLNKLVKNPNIFQKASRTIEKVNNTVESTPRLAEFKNTLAKGGSLDKALYNASDITTNFSRSGNVTKTIDSGVPYLSASVQGLDKVGRQFIKHPLTTTAKGLISVTVPTLALDALNANNPNYQELDNRIKDNYYNFPNPSDGGKTFIRIPKSREIGVLFGSLAERTLRAVQGQDNAFKGFGSTIATNFAPTNPLENNLASPLISNLPSGKDFAGRTIVPQAMQDRSPSLQYDETTSEIGKRLGQITGLSPKKIDYVIKSYTGVIGQLGLPATTAQTYQGNVMGNLLKPITTSFTSNPLYSNQAVTDFYDNLTSAKAAAADKNFTESIPSKTVTPEEKIKNQLVKNSTAMSGFSKEATKAAQAGDQNNVNIFRQKMIDLAKEGNKLWRNK